MMFSKEKSKHLLFLLMGLSSSIAFSASQLNHFLHSVVDVKQYTPLITLSIGPDFVQAGQAQTLTSLFWFKEELPCLE